MSFDAHYKAQRRLHDAAREELSKRIKRPTAEQLLTPAGRARWFRQVREESVKVLSEVMTLADKAGKDHGQEVVAEFEERTA
jgi:hypothetical protein